MPATHHVQYGTNVMTGGLTILDISVLEMDPLRTQLRLEVQTALNVTGASNLGVVILYQDDFTVRLQRYGNTGDVTIHWQVTQFTVDSGTLISRGQTNSSAGSRTTNVTVSGPDSLSRAFCLATGRCFGSDWLDWIATSRLTSTTNLRFELNRQYSFTIWEWEIVYNNTILTDNVYHYSGSAATVGLDVVLSPSVDLSTSFLIGSYNGGGFNDENRCWRLVDSTTLRFFSYFALAWEYAVQVVTSPNISVRRGFITSLNSFENIVLPDLIDWERSITVLGATYGYICCTAAGDQNSQKFMTRADKTTGTNIVLYRGIGSSEWYVPWEVVQYEGDGTIDEVKSRHHVMIF